MCPLGLLAPQQRAPAACFPDTRCLLGLHPVFDARPTLQEPFPNDLVTQRLLHRHPPLPSEIFPSPTTLSLTDCF